VSAALVCLTLLDMLLVIALHGLRFVLPLLLAALILLVVGYWPTGKVAPAPPNWRPELGIAAVIGAIAPVALLSEYPGVLFLAALAAMTTLTARRTAEPVWLRHGAMFLLTLLALLSAALGVLADAPLILLLPLMLGLAATVALNFRVYAFFASKRGPLFALTAMPLLFVYYCYSVLAFCAGVCLQLWSITPRSRVTPIT
jgi:hypothetical protein